MTDYISLFCRNTFGGYIYEGDFSTENYTGMADMARRIAADARFDNTCRQNLRHRDKRTQR